VFALVSLWVLALDLWQVVVHGRTWTGTDGVYIVDQMQYLSWIRSASQHFLIGNLFVLRSTPSDYFQPLIQISGGIYGARRAPVGFAAAVEAGRGRRLPSWRSAPTCAAA